MFLGLVRQRTTSAGPEGRARWRVSFSVGAAVAMVAGGAASAATTRAQHVEKPGANTVPPQLEVTADGETEPVASAGDAADDPAVWVHPTDPAQSVVLGTDKLGGLYVYDLTGRQLQLIDPTSRPNNVDLRYGFPLGGRTVDLVTAAGYGMRFYALDPATRQLTNVTAPTVKPDIPVAGTCMYKSPVSGRFYAVGNTRDGRAEQWELVDEGGLVGIRSVRGPWRIGTQEAEGCVFDDERQVLFHAEEHDGIYRYGAEPDAPTTDPVVVDRPNERLVPDVEGLALVTLADGTGYLIASSQGDRSYAVYERSEPHAFVAKFTVADGAGADACSKTDGIATQTGNLGPAFPAGLFVCQDDHNTAPGTEGNQDFKLIRLERLLDLLAAAPAPAPG